MKTKLIIILSVFFLLKSYTQQQELKILRKKFLKSETRKYLSDYKKYRIKLSKLYPPLFVIPDSRFDTVIKLYEIPLKNKLQLLPFKGFDSIYVSQLKYYDDNEPRNYLDSKYHNELRILTSNELDKLTDVFFNYFQMRGDFMKFETDGGKIGCDDIVYYYPNIIILFKKNGKFIKYMAFPDHGEKRTNFNHRSIESYWNKYELSIEKEKLILKIFNLPYRYN